MSYMSKLLHIFVQLVLSLQSCPILFRRDLVFGFGNACQTSLWRCQFWVGYYVFIESVLVIQSSA